MKIEGMLKKLKFADENTQMICSVPSEGLKSRIYVVGQVLENTPGVVLGEREPILREKSVGTFVKELKTFGPRFKENDFLMASTHELSDHEYEVRYYKLSHITVEAGVVVLLSKEGAFRVEKKLNRN